ncbi:hypothetical protein HT746_27110 [Burkholderia pyrrocinia]|uniref:hypothetical protein n=1 Tax=Burkholderia pyrrocinia TaxID=60550 RepID=UPI001575A758|nr:hypothetical protein [Burkholderia pyrrocinia]NTX30744.1 hypothetical protein [Burkholderia pyrrocinia]
MSHGLCGMRAMRFRLGSRIAKMIWHANLFGENIVRVERTSLPRTRAETPIVQGCHATKQQAASGNELKHCVTKRKSAAKPRLSPLQMLARTRKMKGLTTH